MVEKCFTEKFMFRTEIELEISFSFVLSLYFIVLADPLCACGPALSGVVC